MPRQLGSQACGTWCTGRSQLVKWVCGVLSTGTRCETGKVLEALHAACGAHPGRPAPRYKPAQEALSATCGAWHGQPSLGPTQPAPAYGHGPTWPAPTHDVGPARPALHIDIGQVSHPYARRGLACWNHRVPTFAGTRLQPISDFVSNHRLSNMTKPNMT